MQAPQDQPPPYTPAGQYPHPAGQYPNPPGQYPPPPGQHYPGQATVITTAPTVMMPTMIVTADNFVGSNPALVVCPSCNSQVVTRVESTPSVRTHLMALCLCLLIWPFTCLPYCIGSCNNADHYCTNCGSYIGSYKF